MVPPIGIKLHVIHLFENMHLHIQISASVPTHSISEPGKTQHNQGMLPQLMYKNP